MKKAIILLSLAFLCCSCKLASAISNEKVTLKTANFKFDRAAMIVVPVNIGDSKTIPLFFDTGAPITYIDNIIPGTANKKVIRFGHKRTADGKKTPQRLIVTTIDTPWFTSKNKIIGLQKLANIGCPEKNDLCGLLGIDAFIATEGVLSINNSKGELASYPKGQFERSLLVGYTKINAILNKQSIWIELRIGQNKGLYRFDTGNNSGIITPFDENITRNSSNSVTILGKSFQSASEAFGNETTVTRFLVNMGQMGFDAPVAMQKHNAMKNFGLAAIKLFDWYIDFGTKEIFAKRNANQTIDAKITKAYYTSVIDGEIQVFSKIKGCNEFEIGDSITAVDNKKVTSENICEIQDLLAATEDWSKLSIQKTSKKNKS
jgi:hypothetical protein